MEEKPAVVLNLIPKYPKEHEKDNHDDSSDAAAGSLVGEEKGQAPREEYWHHHMRDHTPEREVGQSDPAEENQGEHHDGNDDVVTCLPSMYRLHS